MRSPLRWWRDRREAHYRRLETRVVEVLRGAPDLSGWPIADRAGLNVGQVYVVLARLENDGRVLSRWADGPYRGGGCTGLLERTASRDFLA